MYWFAEKKEPRALTRSSPLAYLERAGVLGDGGVGRGGGGEGWEDTQSTHTDVACRSTIPRYRRMYNSTAMEKCK